jgi:mono/diheme cytochrome c family protein
MHAPSSLPSSGRRRALALLASVLSIACAFGLAAALRRAEARTSLQQPTPEAWFEAATPTSPSMIAHGRVLFLGSCAHCHGADATGDEGPDLHGVGVSDRYIAHIISHGIKSEMPSFSKKLGRDEIAALTAYVRSLD